MPPEQQEEINGSLEEGNGEVTSEAFCLFQRRCGQEVMVSGQRDF
jgi:hypothetical protein